MRPDFAQRVIAIVAACILAAACSGTPPPSGAGSARLTFEHTGPILLDVAAIEFVEAWQQPGAAPDIGHLHRNNPPSIARAWVAHRLVRAPAASGKGTLRAILRDGSITRTALPVKGGVEGLFTDEPDTRLEARLAVELELVDPAAGRIAGIQVVVTGAREVLQSASLNERDAIYFALMEKLAAALDRELDNGIRAELAFLVRQP